MTHDNKVFADANVVVEIALGRAKMNKSIRLLQTVDEVFISTLSVHLAVHFGAKYSSLDSLQNLLSSFSVLDLNSEDCEWAFKNCRGDDFEDALQIAVAIRNGCTEFVTFDRQLAQTYDNLPTLKMKLLT